MGMLANRLRRTYRHLRKWARRTDVTCFRLYEKDIPDLMEEAQRYALQFVRSDERENWAALLLKK